MVFACIALPAVAMNKKPVASLGTSLA